MNQRSFFANRIQGVLSAVLIFCPLEAFAVNAWSYHQESDRLTNLTYSFAQSPMPRRGAYDDMRLEIVCRDNKLQVVIDADSLITSQGSAFDVEYQIDKKPPVNIQMRTFPDSKRKGYSDQDAKRISDDILTGQAIFIRINTIIKDVLSSSISLQDAAKPIQQVYADCGLALSGNSDAGPVYSLADFERDFGKLSAEQQRQVLDKIKKIIMEIP